MNNCFYCNKKIETSYNIIEENNNEKLTCCSDYCSKKTHSFFEFFNHTKPLFIIGITISIIMIFSSAIILSLEKLEIGGILMGIGFALIGITIIIFPFGTLQTFELFGIRKTIFIIRIIGLIIIILSPLLAIGIMNP